MYLLMHVEKKRLDVVMELQEIYIQVKNEKLLSDEANNDDFLGDASLDFLDQFKCRRKISKEKLHEVIFEIARKEVIEKPHLMASCWQNVFTSLSKTKAFTDISNLNDLYRQLEQTTEKLITLLKSDPRDQIQKEMLSIILKDLYENFPNQILENW